MSFRFDLIFNVCINFDLPGASLNKHLLLKCIDVEKKWYSYYLLHYVYLPDETLCYLSRNLNRRSVELLVGVVCCTQFLIFSVFCVQSSRSSDEVMQYISRRDQRPMCLFNVGRVLYTLFCNL